MDRRDTKRIIKLLTSIDNKLEKLLDSQETSSPETDRVGYQGWLDEIRCTHCGSENFTKDSESLICKDCCHRF